MQAVATPLTDGWNQVSGVSGLVYGNVQAGLGVVITVLAGGRTAWQAAHGKDFTGELISAIAGCCLLAASGWSGGLSNQVQAASTETLGAASIASRALGGIVTVIGGTLTAWRFVHGERSTGYLICTIVGVCIAAATVV